MPQKYTELICFQIYYIFNLILFPIFPFTIHISPGSYMKIHSVCLSWNETQYCYKLKRFDLSNFCIPFISYTVSIWFWSIFDVAISYVSRIIFLIYCTILYNLYLSPKKHIHWDFEMKHKNVKDYSTNNMYMNVNKRAPWGIFIFTSKNIVVHHHRSDIINEEHIKI